MFLPIFLVFCMAALLGYFIIPAIYNRIVGVQQKRAQQVGRKLDRVLSRERIKQIQKFVFFAPFVIGGLFYFLFPEKMQAVGGIMGFIFGIIFPAMYARILITTNKKRFNDQLVDALMIMSSSFRGGLSLIQAMEAVVEEMGDPIAQEFATVLGENSMGVSLEEALTHLYMRMPSSAMQQVITAILLARETGGNLPAIFQRIVGVIRQRRRIEGQIATLTIQGKIQGVVMSLLPVAFFMFIYGSNPGYFDVLFTNETGRAMLLFAIVAEVLGAFMIWRISALREF